MEFVHRCATQPLSSRYVIYKTVDHLSNKMIKSDYIWLIFCPVHVLLLDRCTRPAEKRGTAHADLLVGAQVLADQCKQSAGDSIWVSRTIILYFIVHLLVFTWFLPISEDKRHACHYFDSSMRHVIDVVICQPFFFAVSRSLSPFSPFFHSLLKWNRRCWMACWVLFRKMLWISAWNLKII